MNRLMLLLINCFISSFLNAQTNISLDSDCRYINSAILAQSLIENVGEDTVKELVENDVFFLTALDVDSLGRVIRLNRLIIQKGQPHKELMTNLESYLKRNEKRYLICYERLPGINDTDAYKIIKKDLTDEKVFTINVFFPGAFIDYYEIYKREAEEQKKTLSKYEYFQKMLKEYLLQ